HERVRGERRVEDATNLRQQPPHDPAPELGLHERLDVEHPLPVVFDFESFLAHSTAEGIAPNASITRRSMLSSPSFAPAMSRTPLASASIASRETCACWSCARCSRIETTRSSGTTRFGGTPRISARTSTNWSPSNLSSISGFAWATVITVLAYRSTLATPIIRIAWASAEMYSTFNS